MGLRTTGLVCALLVLASLSAEATSAASESSDDFNTKEAKRAGLTMQAALFERKAATAAARVEHYKKKRDLKNAKAQLALEKSNWQKSQQLVLKAAAAHPLPSPKVAKAAVQAKVATEAARAMKELENKEKDPTEKALDEKVYQIEHHNKITAEAVVKKVMADLNKIPEETRIHKQAESRLAQMKQQQAQAQVNSDKYLRKYKMEKDPAKKKKYAKLTFQYAKKVEDLGAELKVIDNMDIAANKVLFKEYTTVENSAVGSAIAQAKKEAAEEKAAYTKERADLQHYGIKYEEKSPTFKDIEALKKELGKGTVSSAEQEMAKKKQQALAWAKKVNQQAASKQQSPIVYIGIGVGITLVLGGLFVKFGMAKPSQTGYEKVSGSPAEMA